MSGTRFVATAGARLSVEAAAAGAGPRRWEVSFRARAGQDELEIQAGSTRVLATRALAAQPAGTLIQRVVLDSEASKLEVTVKSGKPELFGVVLETGQGGVVVDNLGINGARTATPLAWDERGLVEQVKARDPSLLILAYGTNDVVSELAPSRLTEQYRTLLGRLRQAAPDADCLLMGPPDLAQDGATHPRVIAIDDVEARAAAELGCGYFSMFYGMGGRGSLIAWMRAKPPLAAGDGIHLLPAGYARLGALLAEALIAGFAAAHEN
jgi:lysophospholipase L1-like esterase